MCEFKVYLNELGKESVIAEEIVHAKFHNGKVTMKKVLGDSISIANVMIEEVDVNNEILRLTKIKFNSK